MTDIKTCFTCKNFSWDEGGTCGEGTCYSASSMNCGKGYFHMKSYEDENAMQQTILKANDCKDYEIAKD